MSILHIKDANYSPARPAPKLGPVSGPTYPTSGAKPNPAQPTGDGSPAAKPVVADRPLRP